MSRTKTHLGESHIYKKRSHVYNATSADVDAKGTRNWMSHWPNAASACAFFLVVEDRLQFTVRPSFWEPDRSARLFFLETLQMQTSLMRTSGRSFRKSVREAGALGFLSCVAASFNLIYIYIYISFSFLSLFPAQGGNAIRSSYTNCSLRPAWLSN